jgi:hypothetical protein
MAYFDSQVAKKKGWYLLNIAYITPPPPTLVLNILKIPFLRQNVLEPGTVNMTNVNKILKISN